MINKKLLNHLGAVGNLNPDLMDCREESGIKFEQCMADAGSDQDAFMQCQCISCDDTAHCKFLHDPDNLPDGLKTEEDLANWCKKAFGLNCPKSKDLDLPVVRV